MIDVPPDDLGPVDLSDEEEEEEISPEADAMYDIAKGLRSISNQLGNIAGAIFFLATMTMCAGAMGK